MKKLNITLTLILLSIPFVLAAHAEDNFKNNAINIFAIKPEGALFQKLALIGVLNEGYDRKKLREAYIDFKYGNSILEKYNRMDEFETHDFEAKIDAEIKNLSRPKIDTSKVYYYENPRYFRKYDFSTKTLSFSKEYGRYFAFNREPEKFIHKMNKHYFYSADSKTRGWELEKIQHDNGGDVTFSIKPEVAKKWKNEKRTPILIYYFKFIENPFVRYNHYNSGDSSIKLITRKNRIPIELLGVSLRVE